MNTTNTERNLDISIDEHYHFPAVGVTMVAIRDVASTHPCTTLLSLRKAEQLFPEMKEQYRFGRYPTRYGSFQRGASIISWHIIQPVDMFLVEFREQGAPAGEAIGFTAIYLRPTMEWIIPNYANADIQYERLRGTELIYGTGTIEDINGVTHTWEAN